MGQRATEAEASAAAFSAGAERAKIELGTFRDGFFPYDGKELKSWMEGLKARIQPDVVFTHRRDDAHQDHREVCQLTWNTFRDHLILEYEIPKWDGDLDRPNLYVPVDARTMERKIELLLDALRYPAFQGLVRCRDISRARAPARHGVPRAGGLCGGFFYAEGSAGARRRRTW